MYTPTMMKRSAVGAVYDIPAAPPSQKVPTSTLPVETKVLWLTDPSILVGPREEEARRKGPEMKFLVTVSAVLTVIVFWGIFREVNNYVPTFLHSTEVAGSLQQQQDAATMDQFQANALAFKTEVDNVGGQKDAKRYLEAKADQFPEDRPRKLGASGRMQEDMDFSNPGGGGAGEAAI